MPIDTNSNSNQLIAQGSYIYPLSTGDKVNFYTLVAGVGPSNNVTVLGSASPGVGTYLSISKVA